MQPNDVRVQTVVSGDTHIHIHANHLADAQGEMVDHIEYHVAQSQGAVGQAHQELVKAKEYQSKARKVHTSTQEDR